MGRVRQFTKELFRRRVVRLVGAYVAVFWLLTVGFASLFPALGFPGWVLRLFIMVGIGAIPLLAFLSWKYNIVPPQLIRDSKDAEARHPAHSWAQLRHDNKDAGYVLLSWSIEGSAKNERRFFQPVTIGREPTNDIELPDHRVSRYHAVLWAQNGVWHVRDLDSGNGTFIGHTRVAGTAPLTQSCDLRLHPNGPVVSVQIAKSAETLVG